jgi:ABC-type nitrate/sulfonate/bicarbonate transport system substrate-binding protein
LNPPRHDDPHEDIIIELHPAAATAVADALAEVAEWAKSDGDSETARMLADVADDIKAASVTPADADRAGLSREATWHPSNIMQRLAPAAIRNAAR